jgi:hypothetical protein
MMASHGQINVAPKTLENQPPVDFLLPKFLRKQSFVENILFCAKISEPLGQR